MKNILEVNMENTLDLSKFLSILKKHLNFLILVPIIFVLVSVLVTIFLLKPKYEANTQVLVLSLIHI